MTTTTPPPRTRSRRSRHGDDATSPTRASRTPPDRAGVVGSRADDEVPVRGGAEVRTPTGRSGKGAVTGRRAVSGIAEDTAPAARKTARASGTKRADRREDTRRAQTGAAAPATRRRPARTSAAPRAGRGAARPAPPRARTPFVLLVVGLLGGALVSLLLLNTVLAQDAFTLSELQRGNQQLNERKQALEEDIAREGSPEVLHRKALELGMRDSQRPAFIDARTGRVTEGGAKPPGVPDEAVAAAAAGGLTGAPGAIVPPMDGTAPRHTGTEGGRR